MSYAPSINFVLQRALRKIGAFAISSTAARAPEMEEARYWLDMEVAHLAGKKRTWWLVPQSATFPLVAGQRDYDLMDVLGLQVPDGIEFVVSVLIDHATTGMNIEEVNLLRREEYETAKGDFVNATGAPTGGYIDRAQRPTLRLLQAPDAATPYVARVTFQSYAPNLVAGRDVRKLDQFRTAWNLWLVMATAARIGNGPVRKLPKDEVDDMRRDVAALLHDLESYEDHEQQSGPPVVAFHNF